jgi:phage tail protein X
MPIRLTQPVQGRNAEETVKNIISALRQQQLEIEHYLTHLDGSAITSVDYKPVVSGPATWEEAATNFNLRNDRNQTVPSNPVIADDGTAIDHIINTDGSATISLEWAFVGTGPGYDVDGFIIWVHSSTSATAYTFGTTPASETPFYTPADMRAFVLDSVSADKYYTFGVQAYRNVDQDVNSEGILKSSIVQPSEAGENPYRPSATVAYAGNIIDTLGNQIPVANLETVDGSQLKADGVRYDGQIINDSDVTAYFPFDDSLYDSKNLIPGTFARASVAYLPNGVQVASGIARYDTARIVRGILVEEGTTNLIATPQDLTTQYSKDASVTITANQDGVADLVTCTDGANGYLIKEQHTADGGPYSHTLWAKKGTASTIRVTIYDQTVGAYIASVTFNLTFNYAPYTVSVASTTNGHTLHLYVWFGTGTTYVLAEQLEKKPYATSFIVTTRVAETLTIPTAGVFQKNNWAVELTYIPTSKPDNGINIAILWYCVIDSPNNRYLLYVDTDGKIKFRVVSGGTNYDIASSTALVSGQKYCILVSGDGSKVRLCINGNQIGTDLTYIEPVGSLPLVMQIGQSGVSTAFANGLIDELRFSAKARTLTEHQAYYNSNKGYTDIEPIIRAGLMVNGFMVTPEGGAKCYHSNGSFSQISWEGFMNYMAGEGRAYHHLSEIARVSTVGTGSHSASPWWTEEEALVYVPPITVQLPDRFKGKHFYVTAEARMNDNNLSIFNTEVVQVAADAWYHQKFDWIVDAYDYDYVNGTFKIKAYCWIQIGDTASTTDIERIKGIDVTYTVTA